MGEMMQTPVEWLAEAGVQNFAPVKAAFNRDRRCPETCPAHRQGSLRDADFVDAASDRHLAERP